jgi:ABC-2 type transport system permease protein
MSALTGMSAFTGVRPLLKVSLHQDARNIGPWVVLISVLSVSSILAYAWVFPDLEDRQALSMRLTANPALALVFGPPRDLLTSDGFNSWRAGVLGAFFAGLMAILIVVRNSRAHEDSGQAELIASGVLGRQARLTVAVLMAAVASLALGVVSFVATVSVGGGVLPTLLLSSTYAASGLMFAGVAAVAVQLGSDARAASSLAVAALGVLYVARGYVDSSGAPEWAAWLTPIGWLQETRPATQNDPWPLLLAVGLAFVLVGVAFVLHARRDYGMGLIPPRPGPARGRTVSIWWLALRLNRGALVSWLVAFAGLGVVFGYLATSIGEVVADDPGMARLLAAGVVAEADLEFAFLMTVLQLVGIIAAVLGVGVVMRMYAEETDFRVEPLLAGAVRRRTFLASNAVIAFLAPGVAMLVGGSVVGLVAASVKDSISAVDVAFQAVATVPAVWTLVALALAAVGAHPAKRLVGWLGVVATFGLTILGPTFDLPDWALDISPLRHVPPVVLPDPDWSGLGWVTLVTLLLVAVAFAGFRRRDVG